MKERWAASRIVFILLLVCLGLSLLIYYAVSRKSNLDDAVHRQSLELFGVWMHSRSITDSKKIDQLLAKIEQSKFNSIFVNVFVYGYAYYDSGLLKKSPMIEAGFDPLAYLVEKAHQRNMVVYAWLVAGPVGDHGKPGAILSEHSDWAMVNVENRSNFWLNYNRPDVRKFIEDVAVELVENYDIDGIHFDYLRYPGPQWSFDPYTAQAFAQEHSFDLELLKFTDLPAFATFRGNPLIEPATAQVLAAFDNGLPAVLINRYGAGEVILMNWYANDRQVAVSSEILSRTLAYLSGENGRIYILRSDTNAQKYGQDGFEEVFAWLLDLGASPIEVTESDLATLDIPAVLVMPNIYLVTPQVASDLANFVHGGGGAIFIDGPTPSINDGILQTILGIRGRGKYFEEPAFLIAVDKHSLIPASDRDLDLADYQAMDSQWKAFRKDGLSSLLQNIYQRIKQIDPEVRVTITIAADKENLAERVMLDWQRWLNEKYVDLLIPRAYVDEDESLAPIIADWQPTLERHPQVVLGLKTYTGSYSEGTAKTPERMLAEIRQIIESGSKGVVLFDIESIGEDVLKALTAAPFKIDQAATDN